jgi:hypothetical protein
MDKGNYSVINKATFPFAAPYVWLQVWPSTFPWPTWLARSFHHWSNMADVIKAALSVPFCHGVPYDDVPRGVIGTFLLAIFHSAYECSEHLGECDDGY